MTGFDVTVPAVAHAAGTADSVARDLRVDLDRLRAEAQAVLAGEWSGRVAASFADDWREWDDTAVAVIAALTELGEALRDSARAYSNADADARSTLHLAAS